MTISMSSLKNKIVRQSFNNGIDFPLIRKWTKGDSFIVQLKNDVGWEKPIELIIDHVDTIQSDKTSALDIRYMVYGSCGTKIDIGSGDLMSVEIFHGATFSPRCEKYEIYKTWKQYFMAKDRLVLNKKMSIKINQAFVDDYEVFEKQFKDANPEKLI